MQSDPFELPSAEGLPQSDHGETVVHLSGEYWPYARTGGLAEAVRGIARYQAATGAQKIIMLPLYQTVREGFPELVACSDRFEVPVGPRTEMARVYHHPDAAPNPKVLFIEHDGYFGRRGLYGEGGDYPDNHLRFAFFCRAALAYLPEISPGPTILHAHDWHTALAAVYLRTQLDGHPYYDRVSTVLSVHNAGYQGHYAPDIIPQLGLNPQLFQPDYMEWYGKTNMLKGGLVFSDIVTTVSPTHADELRTEFGGFGLHHVFGMLQDRFVGILNGIDYTVWDPAQDPWIEATYDSDDLSGKAECKAWLQQRVGLPVDPDVPIFGMTARLAQQKGYDIIFASQMLGNADAQWIFLGEGDLSYEAELRRLTEAYPNRVAAFFEFNEEREHRLLAGSDFLLMPSMYEPCGLTQMRSQRYGALPVVRRVGGLADTVEDGVTGFLFDDYTAGALQRACTRAMELYADRPAWEKRAHEAMGRDFSWRAGVRAYQEVYERAREVRKARLGA